ncbi:MAG: hypothetical protein Q8M76_05430 [Spirochaetaceae bacterium]|nr:hypothetical protein [Spirochaetaceae bacterium]
MSNVMRINSVVIILALALASAPAEGLSGLDAKVEVSTGCAGAALRADLSGSYEWMGPVLAARIFGSGYASLGAADPEAGAEPEAGADAQVELSASAGSLAFLLSGRAGIEGAVDLGDPVVAAAGGLTLSLNGFESSASLAGDLDYLSGEGGYLDASARLGASFLAGELVLKAEAAISASEAADGSRSLEIRPRARVTWYPGIPVALAFDAGWRRDTDAAGAVGDFLPASLSIYGAAGEALFDLSAEASIALATGALDEAGADASLSLLLARLAGASAELRLPLGAAWRLAAESCYSVTAGLSVSF